MKFKELDIVNVKAAIVHCYSDGKTYEVEVVDMYGDTVGIFAIQSEDLSLVSKAEKDTGK